VDILTLDNLGKSWGFSKRPEQKKGFFKKKKKSKKKKRKTKNVALIFHAPYAFCMSHYWPPDLSDQPDKPAVTFSSFKKKKKKKRHTRSKSRWHQAQSQP
jgi:hypothetical protein